MNKFILICILAHIIGDFYFQTDKISESKQSKFKYLLIHSFLYLLPFIFLIPLLKHPQNYFPIILLIGLSHFCIDFTKCKLLSLHIPVQLRTILSRKKIYLYDQLLHLLCILMITFFFRNRISIVPQWYVKTVLNFSHTSITEIVKLTTLMLFIYKPTNITFSVLFSDFKPKVHTDKNDLKIDFLSKKAGCYIGFLERIITIIFIFLNAYSAIGFILTAKSVARYDQITKDQQFAEYFLIGTLYSISTCIMAYYFLFFLI